MAENNTKQRILLIDQDQEVVDLLQSRLVTEGFDVEAAPDGLAGLQAARAVRPAAVIIGRLLSDMRGEYVCRELKTHRLTAPVPVTLSGASANTFTGMTTVSAGTLQLNKTAGTDALAGAVTVNSGAVLLIAASNQVKDGSAVTLSGGTIRTAAGVNEVFGNLSVAGSGFLDFGATSFGTANTISFGTYTPSALLTIDNFNFGSTLTFGTDLTGTIGESSLFQFENGGFASTSWDGSTFTITAIPEPSTYAAAAGLIGLMLWPSRRRLLRDAKKILGFTPPMRDRLAARSRA